jgi:hypothetical protein
VAVLAEVVVLWWLASMAWSSSVDEPPLSIGDGIAAVGMVAAVATVLIVAGAVAYATSRRPAAAVALAVLTGLAGVVGFVGGLLIAVSRVDSGEH